MVEATCLNIDKADKVIFDNEVYAKIKYRSDGTLKAYYEVDRQNDKLEIPTIIDNGASVSIMPKWYYDKKKALHALPESTHHLPPITTGNGPIDTYFWIDLPVTIQGAFMQLKCLVCASQARQGLLLSCLALDQMQAVQLYNKREIFLRSRVLPLVVNNGYSIAPGKDVQVVAKLQTDNVTDNFDGTAVLWIYTNNAGFPLQPVVTNYITNIMTITYTNPTAQRQTIPKGSVIGYLDI